MNKSRGGLSEREIMAHCISRLENIVASKLAKFRESFPESPSGKALKRESV